MKMTRRTAAILLVLSLQALIAGRLSAAVADDVNTIRLPSQAEKKMPWKCCDVTECNRMIPPGCRCMDTVERCEDACERCVVSKRDPSKHVCADRYRGFPPKRCTEAPVNGDINHVSTEEPAGRASMEKSAADGEEAARPWTCCDDTVCTRSAPPTCQCLDKLKKCAKTCKSCAKADKSNDGASSRFVCNDRYFGWPGPKCKSGGN